MQWHGPRATHGRKNSVVVKWLHFGTGVLGFESQLLPPSSYVTLAKLLNSCNPQFVICIMGITVACHKVVVRF